MKFCKDCQWCEPFKEYLSYKCRGDTEREFLENYDIAKCTHKALSQTDLVTGNKTHPMCQDARTKLLCGQGGRLFEPKYEYMLL